MQATVWDRYCVDSVASALVVRISADLQWIVGTIVVVCVKMYGMSTMGT